MSQFHISGLHIADERDSEFGPAREMSEADFAAVKKEMSEKASSVLLSSGDLPPAIYAVTMGESAGEIARIGIAPVAHLINEPQGKEVIVQVMEQMLTDPNHDFVVFAHEAWVLKAKVDAENKEASIAAAREAAKKSLEHHPERTEAIFMQLRSKSRSAVCVLDFGRDAQGQVAAIQNGELVFADAPNSTFEGRMAPPAARRGGATLH